MVANDFFAAADPKAGVTAADFQYLVEQMYWKQDTTQDEQWVAQIAENSELPAEVVDRIASGDEAVDVNAMNRANTTRLEEFSGKMLQRRRLTTSPANRPWISATTNGCGTSSNRPRNPMN